MAAVTIDLIKALRDRTGAGIMDCKKALLSTDGDIEKAIDFLREKGIAKAMASHNHGTGGRFWPYTLYKYNKRWYKAEDDFYDKDGGR